MNSVGNRTIQGNNCLCCLPIMMQVWAGLLITFSPDTKNDVTQTLQHVTLFIFYAILYDVKYYNIMRRTVPYKMKQVEYLQ